MKRLLAVVAVAITLKLFPFPMGEKELDCKDPLLSHAEREDRRICSARAVGLADDATFEEIAEHGRPDVARSVGLHEDATWEQIIAALKAAEEEDTEPT